MAKLINDEALKSYVKELVYNGEEPVALSKDILCNKEEIEAYRDAIAKAIVMQWMKKRLPVYLTAEEEEKKYQCWEIASSLKVTKTEREAFLLPVSKDEHNLPEWAISCLKKGEKLCLFDKEGIPDSVKTKITCALNYLYYETDAYIEREKNKKNPRIDVGYLKSGDKFVTFDDAVRAGEIWKKKEAYYRIISEGTEFVTDLGWGMYVVRLTTPEALDDEGKCVGHCVGDDVYEERIKKGAQIFSFRDAKGRAHVTMEVVTDEATGEKLVNECKGKGNAGPNKQYVPYVQKFIVDAGFGIKNDEVEIGLFKQDGRYYRIDRYGKKYDFKQNGKYYWIKQSGIHGINSAGDLEKVENGFVVDGDVSFGGRLFEVLPDLSGVIIKGHLGCMNVKELPIENLPSGVGSIYTDDKSVFVQDKKIYCVRDDGIYEVEHGTLKKVPKGFEVKVRFDLRGGKFSRLPDLSDVIIMGDLCCRGIKDIPVDRLPQKVGYIFSDEPIFVQGGKCYYIKDDGMYAIEQGKFEKVPNGYTVKCSVDISDKGFKVLPDFSGVSISGDFNCAGIDSVSPERLPIDVKGLFYCNQDFVKKYRIYAEEDRIGLFYIKDYSKISAIKGDMVAATLKKAKESETTFDISRGSR